MAERKVEASDGGRGDTNSPREKWSGPKLGLPGEPVSLPVGPWAGPLWKMLPWAISRLTVGQSCLSPDKGMAKPPVFFSRWVVKWRTERQREETHWVGAPAARLASSCDRRQDPYLCLSFHIHDMGNSWGFLGRLFGIEQIFIKHLLYPLPILGTRE